MKKIIWIFIVILIFMIIGGILIIYSVFGNNRYNLKNISDSQKEEIMELLKGNNINSINDLEIAKRNINSILLKENSINKKSPAIVLEFESSDS